ncbi:MAG: sulfatase-like hydrolase/transferase, partial [Myxococcota bacterium]
MSKLSERSQHARGFLGLLLASALAAGCGGAQPPDLLLLVTVDTLRADELGAYGSRRGLTPQLDALAADSVLFERAYASASFTLPSIATLLSGRYPEELGIRDNESGLPASVPTLATELAGRGWR